MKGIPFFVLFLQLFCKFEMISKSNLKRAGGWGGGGAEEAGGGWEGRKGRFSKDFKGD